VRSPHGAITTSKSLARASHLRALEPAVALTHTLRVIKSAASVAKSGNLATRWSKINSPSSLAKVGARRQASAMARESILGVVIFLF
jgi:hypothetical protein